MKTQKSDCIETPIGKYTLDLLSSSGIKSSFPWFSLVYDYGFQCWLEIICYRLCDSIVEMKLDLMYDMLDEYPLGNQSDRIVPPSINFCHHPWGVGHKSYYKLY